MEEYHKDISALRKKYKIPENGFKYTGTKKEVENQEYMTFMTFEVKKKGFPEDIEELIFKYQKYGLNYSYKETIEKLILFEHTTISLLNFEIKANWFRIPPAIGKGEHINGRFKKLMIEIYGNTTFEDLKKGWKDIDKYRKELPDYNPKSFRPYKNTDRDRRIDALFKAKTPIKEIEKIINDEFPEKVISYEYLYRIRDRYLKKKK